TYNMMELECERIEEEHLPAYLRNLPEKAAETVLPSLPWSPPLAEQAAAGTLPDRLKQLECDAILGAMKMHGYNITLAAEALGIKRQALQYKLNRYGIAK